MAAILNFCIFAKNAKTKNSSISLTIRDRVISSKFSTHRVFKQYTLPNLQKKFLFPKMVAILNFRIFAKSGKAQNCFYLLNHQRQSNFVPPSRVSKQYAMLTFGKLLKQNILEKKKIFSGVLLHCFIMITYPFLWIPATLRQMPNYVQLI